MSDPFSVESDWAETPRSHTRSIRGHSRTLAHGALFPPELAGSASRQHVRRNAPDHDAVLVHGLAVIEANEPRPPAACVSRPTHSCGPVTRVAVEQRLLPVGNPHERRRSLLPVLRSLARYPRSR